MNILLGSIRPDEGTMILDGKPYAPGSPHDALEAGISMIHQELCLVPSMSVAENIWIGREDRFCRKGILNASARRQAAADLLSRYGMKMDPDAVTGSLSIAQQQMAELFRAISYDAKIIIMDEPTSSLTSVEVEILHRVIRQLTAEGRSVLYISHKLDEILTFCNRVMVMRDGCWIADKDISEVNADSLVSLMVGRSIEDEYPVRDETSGEVILEVRNLSRAGQFSNISFHACEGEIVGFCGLIGAGRSEIMNAIFGRTRADSGEILLHGKRISNRNVKDAIGNHIAMVNEDRSHYGIFPMLSSRENITIATLDRVFRHGIVQRKEEVQSAEQMMKKMHVKVSTCEQTIGTLSGGNQQKVIIGRWLLAEPEVLIMDEPTRGIDVGAKAEIYRLMAHLASEKKTILLVSSELSELTGMCDRIYVVAGGEIMAELKRGEYSEEIMMQYAFGLSRQEGRETA
jgi:ABC-type sugar transport system ATPase subunit